MPLVIIVFAFTYLSLSRAHAANFSEPMDHVGAVYFTITVISTVGFGDIVAKTDVARMIVSFQILLDLGLVVGMVRTVVYRGAGRRSPPRRAASRRPRPTTAPDPTAAAATVTRARVRPRHPAERESARALVPTSYEIRIKGRLGKPMVAAFGGFAASVRAPETVLSGAIADQHALLPDARSASVSGPRAARGPPAAGAQRKRIRDGS